jgi:hypothetical protein
MVFGLVLDQVGVVTSLSWSEATGVDFYDVLRSNAANDFVSGSPCWGLEYSTSFSDTSTPGSGSVYYYLIRAVNDCGQGPVGANSEGVPRAAASCP